MDQSRFRGNSRRVQAAAREMRREPTRAEDVLWEALRARRLDGLRFRRQHPVENFVLDFYCPIAKLVIEVDGGVHDQQQERDEGREAHVAAYGYHTLRFRNEEVLHDLPSVLARIKALVTERRAAPRPRRTMRDYPEWTP